jgi:hypothetical protein
LGGWGSKGAIFFHCASVSNGPDRAIGPPSALLTLLIPHFPALNHNHFRALSQVVQQLLVEIPLEVRRKLFPEWLQSLLDVPALQHFAKTLSLLLQFAGLEHFHEFQPASSPSVHFSLPRNSRRDFSGPSLTS